MFLIQRECNEVYYLLLSVSPFLCLSLCFTVSLSVSLCLSIFHCVSHCICISLFVSFSLCFSLFPFLSLSLSLSLSPFFCKHRTEIDGGLCDRCPSILGVSLPRSLPGPVLPVCTCSGCFPSLAPVPWVVSAQTIIIAPVMTGFVGPFSKTFCLTGRVPRLAVYFGRVCCHVQIAMMTSTLWWTIYSTTSTVMDTSARVFFFLGMLNVASIQM